MRKYLLFLFFASFIKLLYSQNIPSYYTKTKAGDKYFISAGLGVGTAKWNSLFENTDFYDKDGAVINKGDFYFGAKSPTTTYDLNVLVPIKHIRFGLGIGFEYHYLTQLQVYDKSGSNYLLFDEMMRFDKIYLDIQVPFKYSSRKKYSFNWDMRCGWFGYTNVKRFNFIGEKPFPLAIWANTGVMVDYLIYHQILLFLYPNFEFKYYSNSHTEDPVDITHRIMSASIIGGVRVNLKK